jgi:transcriptional regulator with XRE-family HTH domain
MMSANQADSVKMGEKFFPSHCKSARGVLGWSLKRLAAAADVAPDTVKRFERGDDLKERTVKAIRVALEAAGVHFTVGDDPGLRFPVVLSDPVETNGSYVFECRCLEERFEVRADKRMVDRYVAQVQSHHPAGVRQARVGPLQGRSSISIHVRRIVSKALFPRRKRRWGTVLVLSQADFATRTRR